MKTLKEYLESTKTGESIDNLRKALRGKTLVDSRREQRYTVKEVNESSQGYGRTTLTTDYEDLAFPIPRLLHACMDDKVEPRYIHVLRNYFSIGKNKLKGVVGK